VSGRIRITGYYSPSASESDTTDRTGLTAEAYDSLITGEDGAGLAVADLEDLEVGRRSYERMTLPSLTPCQGWPIVSDVRPTE
jgi:hypothetical protein